MGLAERADVIVDFTNVPFGNYVLGNVGPDEPFGGGVPGLDFPFAGPCGTGEVMQFRVVPAVSPIRRPRRSSWSYRLSTAAASRRDPTAGTHREGGDGCRRGGPGGGPFEALLGTVNPAGVWTERKWMDPVTENPHVGATEVWEFYNTTGDAHPMHVHEVTFEVVNRQEIRVDETNQTVQVVPRYSKTARALGDGRQGHRHRLPGRGDPHQGPVQNTRPVRLALPHRRARGQRDDAAVPHRSSTAGPAPRLAPRIGCLSLGDQSPAGFRARGAWCMSETSDNPR